MRKLIAFLLFFFVKSLAAQNVWTIYNTGNSLLPDNTIRAIEQDNAGNVWIGTDNGLAKFDGTNFTVIDSSNSGLIENQIRSIAFDTANNLWVGTLPAGVSFFNGSAWTNYNTGNSLLPTDQVRAIAFDAENTPWFGTTGGVARISDEGWEIYNMFNSPLGANNINHIFIDENDTKWIGTVNGGICKKQGNTLTTYNNLNSGLTDNTILDLEKDIYGNIWFATPAQGLGRFNGTSWFYRLDANSAIPTNSITSLEIVLNTDVKYMGTYDKGLVRWNNSLVFDSFTIHNSPIPDNYISCMKRMADGKLWMGTLSSGLVVFNDTTQFSIVNQVTEIENITLNVFPNPAYDKITVALPCKEYTSEQSIGMYDMQGRKMNQVRFETVGNNEWKADVSALESGVYFLSVWVNSVSGNAKIVKQ